MKFPRYDGKLPCPNVPDFVINKIQNSDKSQRELARIYNISENLAGEIKRGERITIEDAFSTDHILNMLTFFPKRIHWIKRQTRKKRLEILRFLNNLESKNGILMWAGTRSDTGYGSFKAFRGGKRKTVSTHRYSWELMNGKIQKGIQVLHKNDTPWCCDPKYLFLGTHQDNMTDMCNKERQQKGMTHYCSKLKEFQVKKIFSLAHKGSLTLLTIAGMFGISQNSVFKIKKAEVHKDITILLLKKLNQKQLKGNPNAFSHTK